MNINKDALLFDAVCKTKYRLSSCHNIDSSTVPLVGLVTTLMLVPSAIVFSINLIKAVHITTHQLRVYCNYPIWSLEKFDVKATLYVVAAAITVAICVAALFVDFFMLHVRQGRRGSSACAGLAPFITMMVILFAMLIGWLWILHKAIEAQFLYRIMVDECTSPTVGSRCLWLVFMRWFRPNNVGFSICNENFIGNCENMNMAFPLYQTVATCAVLIVFSLIHYLVCMATHYAYFSQPEPEPPSTRSESSTIVGSRSSRHSSLRSRDRDRHSDSDENRQSYNHKHSHM